MSHDSQPPGAAPAALMSMITGFVVSQAIHVAARLGLADLLHDGLATSEELARATGVHAPSLRRLLRLLAAVGVLDETAPGRFALTPLGALLRRGVPGSLHHAALMFGADSTWRAWGELEHSVRTGQPAFEHVFGMRAFEHRARHPESGAIFHQAMSELTRRVAAAVVRVYDFSAVGTLVDLGGGHGALVAGILAVTPGLRAVVFDQPTGAAEATRQLAAAGVADRCRVVGGDFFESVPGGGDAYILKSVIHDWDDQDAAIILGNCRRAMPAGGRLLILERLLPARVEASAAHREMLTIDLNMLVIERGRERTEEEYRRLLAASGFTLARVVPAGETTFTLLEAVVTAGGPQSR